jgi:hypothetical protein
MILTHGREFSVLSGAERQFGVWFAPHSSPIRHVVTYPACRDFPIAEVVTSAIPDRPDLFPLSARTGSPLSSHGGDYGSEPATTTRPH